MTACALPRAQAPYFCLCLVFIPRTRPLRILYALLYKCPSVPELWARKQRWECAL